MDRIYISKNICIVKNLRKVSMLLLNVVQEQFSNIARNRFEQLFNKMFIVHVNLHVNVY